MTMTTITTEKIEELRRLALAATPGEWTTYINMRSGTFAVHTPDDARKGNVVGWPGFDGDARSSKKQAAANARHIAAANPATILALLDLAQRAPQPEEGQALPELPKPDFTIVAFWVESGDTPSTYRKDLGLLSDVPVFKEETVRAYASQLALPAGPVSEGELKEILGDLWDEGYVSPATYNDVDIRDPEERQRMRDHNVSEAQRRIAAALSSPSPAVAQPVADDLYKALATVRTCDLSDFPGDVVAMIDAALQARAALCPPAEEPKPHEWSVKRDGYFDVFNDDGTVYVTVFNSLEALSYLENGWRVEEKKPGQPAEEGGKS